MASAFTFSPKEFKCLIISDATNDTDFKKRELLYALGDLRSDVGYLQDNIEFKHNRKKLIEKIEELQSSVRRGNFH